MKNRTYIYRDPFARIEIFRELITDKIYRSSCDWCGAREGKFTYWSESHGGRKGQISGAFCSADCCKAYNNLPKGWCN